jgi:hypothetical protein
MPDCGHKGWVAYRITGRFGRTADMTDQVSKNFIVSDAEADRRDEPARKPGVLQHCRSSIAMKFRSMGPIVRHNQGVESGSLTDLNQNTGAEHAGSLSTPDQRYHPIVL